MAKGNNKKGKYNKGKKVSPENKQVHISNRKTTAVQKTVIITIIAAFVVSTLLTGLAGMGAF